MNTHSKRLLTSLFALKHEELVMNTTGSLGILSKQSRLNECLGSIILFIGMNPKGYYSIQSFPNEEGISDVTLSFYTSSEITDHTKRYIITLSANFETYAVKEIFIVATQTCREIKDFDKNKSNNG